MFTNIPGDVWTNTWHFTEVAPIGLAAGAAQVTPLLQAFYRRIYTAARPMANYCLPSLGQAVWYDLAQPQPRVPLILPIVPATDLGVSVVPTEVSAVLSFQGDRLAGVPQARRRGRVYLGALTNQWLVNSATNAYPVINGLVTAAMATSSSQMITDLGGTGMRWSVWSTTDASSALVTNGWADNSPDTQRRRSVDSTSRTLWP